MLKTINRTPEKINGQKNLGHKKMASHLLFQNNLTFFVRFFWLQTLQVDSTVLLGEGRGIF